MITDRELAEQLTEGELAFISAEFWRIHKPVRGPIDPDHRVWTELKAFQAGWLACKNFYKIRD